MAPPRRRTDEDDRDYTPERGVPSLRGRSPLNGHTKWVVGAVGTLIIMALVALVSRDRLQIDREQVDQNGRLGSLEKSMTSLASTVAASNAVDDAFRQEIRASLAEIKADLKEVKREVRQ